MTDPPKQFEEIIIFAPTPSFLERGDLPFAENLTEYKNLRLKNSFIARNTLIIEKDSNKKPSELAREISDLGYARHSGELHKGEFFGGGGLITIFPINSRSPITIEFDGNKIASILESKIIPHINILPKITKHKLEPGDFVVHEDHGIGIFRGVVSKSFDTTPVLRNTKKIPLSSEARQALGGHEERAGGKYFILEYGAARKSDETDKLYVPERMQNKISPYLGLKNPEVSRLGTAIWIKTRKKAKEDIIKFARELLELYKTRAKVKRAPFAPTPYEKEIFDSFEHVQTKSQERSIAEILRDLEKDEPMERLVVGDVGFGKTEAAFSAAVRVALSGRQVAILSPTTVLADQHSETFSRRLSNSGLVVRRLTRLESCNIEKEVLHGLKTGSIDIIIGTHRLLSKDIEFSDKGGPTSGGKNLGLLIIDEEQRFGVRQKETIKEKYTGVDILYLSATPIPRTLAFSFSKIRPMSVIDDPPLGRKSVETFVLPRTEKIVREAVIRELERRGQIYFLSSRIHKIPFLIDMLKKIAPKAHIAGLHGKMSEQELVKIMHGFREGGIDILVSTTIIENGLDISNANTIIIEDATRLGLAEAHQLRGRIGRGHKQAYAYFLYSSQNLKPKAEERLKTLLEYQELGSGFEIAKRDLELRGAGNILGREQTGVVNRIGWNLYFQYLSESLEELM